MSKWDKIIERILEKDRSLRFDELARALIKIGYTEHQPKRRKQPLYIQKKWLHAYNAAEEKAADRQGLHFVGERCRKTIFG